MNKKKILSLIMALVMLVGVFSPLTALAAEATTTESVTLHKLIMTKDELSKWDSAKIEEKGYNGTQDTNQLKDLLDSGHTAHEVEGVYFALKFAKDFEIPKENENTIVAKDVSDGKAYVKAKGTSGAGKLTPAEPLTSTTNVDEAVGGKTTANGVVFVTSGLKGKFEIDEIHNKSSYKGKNGETLTGMKAVPTEITLPLVNNDGIVGKAHVYPKNTEDKPKIDKNFSADEAKKYMSEEEKTKLDAAIEHKAAFEKAKKLYKEDAKEYTDAKTAYTKADQDLITKWGIDFEANTRGKQTLNKKIGDDVEYTVVTDIPTQTKWATAKWDDKMTEGLTYNMGSLSIKLEILNEEGQNKGNYTEVTLTKDTDYKVTEDKNGFVLNFEKSGLEKLNNKAQNQKVTLKYSAKVNNTTVADVPESNDVTFHYGNNPGKGNTPIPTKPNDNGEITINKTWDNGSEWAEGEYAKFKLVDANTGKDVTVDDVDQVAGYTFEGTVTLEKDGKTSYTWKGLKKDRQYKAIEIESKTLADAEYKKSADGTIEVTNHKTDNPTPLNPSEPKVVNGGRRFVKTNNEEKGSKKLERLAGAEFYVVNNIEGDANNGKYLVAAKKDATKVTEAKSALDKAVEEYNKLTAEEQAGETGKTKKNAIDSAQEAYNKAFKENATEYTWGNKDDANVVVLTSDAQGRFEITGLAYGKYKLEEKTAPKGFAKLNANDKQLEFEVKEGSYDGADSELDYQVNQEVTKHGQQIKNKTVSIPQTGGMGTVLFTVVGIGLMAGAVMAMKKNREEA